MIIGLQTNPADRSVALAIGISIQDENADVAILKKGLALEKNHFPILNRWEHTGTTDPNTKGGAARDDIDWKFHHGKILGVQKLASPGACLLYTSRCV